mmetsp:Transcript_36231/g.47594  ORF Transcript_36231/g.47594 Transcript_36231/m.47594 type:complete len:186 (-) Transcript_36231:71-628(-)|eukprot:CAMPEP_0185582192 /NCGR_PEP_ID=MMETSP0434-20130131/20126_1 /TAXON_ID=626734 ORGANISM="Favella taraikaensis, Strain Fe Narragansett Bay" /NCGR_SAMPLE_ID=MMETSP0434 /ASSEMBLY_ACC=CAM_ASM_000379 /LENGTH=185 /DNA_ID=CAMNT_0028200953 /DNA_START=37 /DNA_END=594 /DNA_ORIENTATION=+
MAIGLSCELVFRLFVRAVHLISSMLMLTILILECCFNLEKNTALYENENFKRTLNFTGIAMIVTGILLTTLMSKTDALPAQNRWLTYFPPKFFMSLLLTPISDKMALLLVGYRRSVVYGDEDARHQEMFEMSNDWRQTIKMFRLGVICMLYLYSAYVRKFREDNKNFVDMRGLAKMLDRFIRKSP